jgi:hypothetical protein
MGYGFTGAALFTGTYSKCQLAECSLPWVLVELLPLTLAEGLGEVLQEVKAIGDLECCGGALPGPVSISF